MAVAGSHLYSACIYEVRDNDVTEIDKQFGGIREFRAWCRARYGSSLIKLSPGEYMDTVGDIAVLVKLDKVY